MISIGIDTGGTYTDAVVYDTSNHQVLTSCKRPTTHQDLKVGILQALSALDKDAVAKAEYISLSTTLATNACVENKGARAGLIFIGVKPKAVQRMQGTYGLPPVSEIYFLEGDPKTGTIPNWKQFRRDMDQFRGFDAVAIVQINAMLNDGGFEKEAEAILKEHHDCICVRGYELYQEINVQKRGATALLNARLIPVVRDFLHSIDVSLAEMGIDLPVFMVKSDGSVMSRDFAERKPVETLLSGPAASVIGSLESAEARDGLVVDIGGTTSDIALLRDGQPVRSGNGITIGKWRTLVDGISIDTFALGGDSMIEHHNGLLSLADRRAIPLCMLASEHPEILKELRHLVDYRKTYGFPANQYFVLVNEPRDLSGYAASEQRLVEALRKGPLSWIETAKVVGVSPYYMKLSRLEDAGIIMRSAVTPTDIMHIRGDYESFCTEASQLGVDYLALVTHQPSASICDQVYQMIRSKLYRNLVRILLKHEYERDLTEAEVETLDEISGRIFTSLLRGEPEKYIAPRFSMKQSIIGIGAPAEIFLRQIPEFFQTERILPEGFAIANAIGAAVGNFNCRYTVRIVPPVNQKGVGSFLLLGGEYPTGFGIYEKAVEAAKELASSHAIRLAVEQGADPAHLKVGFDKQESFFKAHQHADPLFVEASITATVISSLDA